jgi:ankyrin repeat protein
VQPSPLRRSAWDERLKVKAGKKRILWVVIAGFLICFGAPLVLICQQIRQDNLDHALIQAVKDLNVTAVNRLLDLGANANARDTAEPPLTLPRLLQCLLARLQHKPFVLAYGERESALLVVLSGEGLLGREGQAASDAIAVMLIRHGASIDVRGARQWSPLHSAACFGLHQTARLLLSRGADVRARNYDGNTPLMDADAENTQLLLDHGADVHATSAIGTTPLMDAVLGDHLQTAAILIQHGADVNATNPGGYSNLYYAKALGVSGPDRIALIRLLKQHGARLNKKDEEVIARHRAHLP